ncbi:MAG: hypothetical protein JWO62_3535 [Acidimicrobiaceae bacterium]|nr:hypothetical protein [Acidimicrobiaceae bacterium]
MSVARSIRGVRFKLPVALAASVMAIGAVSFALISPAAASPSISVSFSSTGTGSGAGWVGPGHSAGIYLTIGSPSSSTNAVAVLHHVPSALLATGPTFTTDNYNSGSPRWDIFLSSGAYLFGYPPNAQIGNTSFAWSVNNCGTVDPNVYYSYSDAVAAVNANCSGTVTAAWVIADGDQSPGTTDTITNLNYGGPISH